MAKKKHWSEAEDKEEMIVLLIEEGYHLSFICQIVEKNEQFVQQVAEKYELVIRPEPLMVDPMYWLKKQLNLD